MRFQNSIMCYIILFLLNSHIAKSEKIEDPYRVKNHSVKYRKLPVSKQFCVGDNCMASFAINKKKRVDSTTAIQVGAFRRYKGAKIYARRYGMLSNRYRTVIKEGLKYNRPIYRVQIEGFSNEDEANAFIGKYPILRYSDSFLVRR